MRFFLLSGAALLAVASAVELNEWPAAVEAGKSYNITYSPKDNTPTTLTLRKGDRNDLKDVAVLTTSATGGSFLWTVDRALENDNDYALQIEQAGADPNYSSQFPLTGGVDDDNNDDDDTSSSSSAARPSATSASSASASAPASSSGNGTVTSAALSTTASPTASPTASDDDNDDDDAQSSQTDSTGAPQNTGAASALGASPLALLFGAAAAVVYLN